MIKNHKKLYYSANLIIFILILYSMLCVGDFVVHVKFRIDQNITIQNIIYDIPRESLREYVNLDLNLPNYNYNHIMLFNEPKFNGSIYYHKGVVDEINQACWKFNASYICVKYVYCCGNTSFCLRNFTLIWIDKTQHFWIRKPLNGSLQGSYDNIIALGHSQIFQFGHFFSDVLIPLLMFPQDVISKSYLLLNANSKKHVHYLKYIGFLTEKVIFLKKRQWLFATNLYTPIDPLVHISHYGKLSNTFSKKLRNYFNLTNVIPDKYYITNRDPKQSRHIANMEEVYQAIVNEYPERNFEILPDIQNFDEAAYYWGRAKLVFGPTGSNLFKHYIMANKTILVVIAAENFDNALVIGTGSHDVFALFSILPGMPHFHIHVNVLNISEALILINIALNCIDNGHFDSK